MRNCVSLPHLELIDFVIFLSSAHLPLRLIIFHRTTRTARFSWRYDCRPRWKLWSVSNKQKEFRGWYYLHHKCIIKHLTFLLFLHTMHSDGFGSLFPCSCIFYLRNSPDSNKISVLTAGIFLWSLPSKFSFTQSTIIIRFQIHTNVTIPQLSFAFWSCAALKV